MPNDTAKHVMPYDEDTPKDIFTDVTTALRTLKDLRDSPAHSDHSAEFRSDVSDAINALDRIYRCL